MPCLNTGREHQRKFIAPMLPHRPPVPGVGLSPSSFYHDTDTLSKPRATRQATQTAVPATSVISMKKRPTPTPTPSVTGFPGTSFQMMATKKIKPWIKSWLPSLCTKGGERLLMHIVAKAKLKTTTTTTTTCLSTQRPNQSSENMRNEQGLVSPMISRRSSPSFGCILPPSNRPDGNGEANGIFYYKSIMSLDYSRRSRRVLKLDIESYRAAYEPSTGQSIRAIVQAALEKEFPPPVAKPLCRRQEGFRGQDLVKRAPRTCKSCKRHGGKMYATCKGRGPRGKCEYTGNG